MVKRNLNISVVGIPKVPKDCFYHRQIVSLHIKMHSYVHKYIYQYWDQSHANSVYFLFSHPISSYLVLISYFPCICAKFSHQTIDNDVDLIDRSFGFTTSVEAAQTAILSAKTEARCNLPNGIGNQDNSTEKKSDMRSEKWHLLKEFISSSGHLPS